MNFVVIDFETANANLSSICQIGLATFEDGIFVSSWETLVNPEDYFDGMNIAIHGIKENDVKDAPTFPVAYDEIKTRLAGKTVVSHTMFDRIALNQAIHKHSLEQLTPVWVDSAKVARRAWPEFSHSGYGLKNLAKHLNITFKHHNAAEDARATGEILVCAIKQSNLTLNEWIERIKRPISPSNISIDGNHEGALFGEVVVFTGALSIHRNEAAMLAAAAGCKVAPSVNKTTTILIVGDQDIKYLAGYDKSSKHRKVEELISKGQQIRILGESDFKRLISQQ